MSAKDAVARLVANDSRASRRSHDPEGSTVSQILKKASSVTDIPVARHFRRRWRTPPATPFSPAEANGNYEGWLFPTTYVLEPQDKNALAIIQGMVSQTVMKLDELGVAPERTVLMQASLIEREAGVRTRDRCPSVSGHREPSGDGDAPAESTRRWHRTSSPGTRSSRRTRASATNPYNTYAHNGLPPGPIASPGAASMQAVLNPERPGEWLFWTTVDYDTKETRFAVTLAEHNRNVDALKQWLAENEGWAQRAHHDVRPSWPPRRALAVPVLHRAAYDALGLDGWSYEAIDTTEEQLRPSSTASTPRGRA